MACCGGGGKTNRQKTHSKNNAATTATIPVKLDSMAIKIANAVTAQVAMQLLNQQRNNNEYKNRFANM